MAENQAAEAKQEKVVPEISILKIQEMLKEGIERPAIGKMYGLNKTETAELFKHEKLIGLKTFKTRKKGPAFIIADDAPVREKPYVSPIHKKKEKDAAAATGTEQATANVAPAQEAAQPQAPAQTEGAAPQGADRLW